jgi:hypothetical protein
MLRNSHRSALVPPNTGQKGERHNKNKRLRPPWVPKPPRPTQCNPTYCHVSAAHSSNPFAIAPLTTRQRVAANKILLHVHLACHSTPHRMALQAPARMRESLGPKANTSHSRPLQFLRPSHSARKDHSTKGHRQKSPD